MSIVAHTSPQNSLEEKLSSLLIGAPEGVVTDFILGRHSATALRFQAETRVAVNWRDAVAAVPVLRQPSGVATTGRKLALISPFVFDGDQNNVLDVHGDNLNQLLLRLDVERAVHTPCIRCADSNTDDHSGLNCVLQNELYAVRHLSGRDLVVVGADSDDCHAIRALRAEGVDVTVLTWAAILDLELVWAANRAYTFEKLLADQKWPRSIHLIALSLHFDNAI